MKNYFKLALLLFTMNINVSMARSPVRTKLTASIIIDAPADAVWAEIGNIEDMYWHPDVVDITLDEESPLSRPERVLTLRDGNIISETIKKYDAENMFFKYKITDMSFVGVMAYAGRDYDIPALSVNEFAGKMIVKKLGQKSIVTWVGGYYPIIVMVEFVEDKEDDKGFRVLIPPFELSHEAGDKSITHFFTTGLVGLARIFDSTAINSDVKIEVRR